MFLQMEFPQDIGPILSTFDIVPISLMPLATAENVEVIPDDGPHPNCNVVSYCNSFYLSNKQFPAGFKDELRFTVNNLSNSLQLSMSQQQLSCEGKPLKGMKVHLGMFDKQAN